MTVNGVYFKCPMVTKEKLTKKAMELKIRDFLYEKLEIDTDVTCCCIIHTLNQREKALECMGILTKYLENIFYNPAEPKFQKIRLKNRVFQEKVAIVNGAHDFLVAAGFELRKIQSSVNDEPEDFYVFRDDRLRKAQRMLDLLRSTKPIIPELDRDIKVLMIPEGANFDRVNRFKLSPEFYEVSTEDIKREQRKRREHVEKDLTLRTRAMREEDEKQELHHYEYTVLRIRFPDGIVLQGTFSVHEKLSSVEEFVRGCLVNDWQAFILITATGIRLTKMDYTLLKLRLMPAVVLHFAWEAEDANRLKSETGLAANSFLNQEAMSLLENLTNPH